MITRLAKLRSLFVIAQGTVFALHERRIGPEEAGRMLNVDYVVSGSVRRQGKRLTVTVELAETRTARIVWAEVFDHKLGRRVPRARRDRQPDRRVDRQRDRDDRAQPRDPEAAELARRVGGASPRPVAHVPVQPGPTTSGRRHFFETAVRLDPTFARAYAGLSFTHFQNAFQGWAEREPEIDRAFEAAGQSLMVDDRDPAAHWAMGRALWLRGAPGPVRRRAGAGHRPEPELRARSLHAGVRPLAGGRSARRRSRLPTTRAHLSPFDPLLFAMLGARAMALVRLGRSRRPPTGASRPRRPNAHAHIQAIAAYCLALAGRLDEARVLIAAIHTTLPQLRHRRFPDRDAVRAGGEGSFERRRSQSDDGL